MTVVFVSDVQKDVVRIEQSHQRRHQWTRDAQNEDIFNQPTLPKDVPILDVKVDQKGYDDGVDDLRYHWFYGDTDLEIVHGVLLLDHSHILDHF